MSYREGITIKVRTARKYHHCSQEWAHDRTIKDGERYGDATIFRSSDAHHWPTTGPVRQKLCMQCVHQWRSELT